MTTDTGRWCSMGRGPCNERCGSQCALRLSHEPWPEQEKTSEPALWFVFTGLILAMVSLGLVVARVLL